MATRKPAKKSAKPARKGARKAAPSRSASSSKRPARRAPARKTAARRSTAAARPSRPKHPPSPTQLFGVSPSFTVNDIEKSLAFYRDVLGFAVLDRWEQDGRLQGLMMSAGDVVLMLGQDDWAKGRDRKKGEGFRVYCMAQDVDTLAEAMKRRGAAFDQELVTEEWGRFFSLTDPDGFRITFAKLSRQD